MTGLSKILFQSSTFSCPCSERKDKNENYLKDTIPKTFSPGLVKISFDIPADFLFQKSENFCSFFEKMLQCKTVFFCKKNFLGKLLRWRKVQFWKQLKNFVTCPNCHRSNSENKHKLTTFPKSGPPHEPVDMLNADWRPCWSFFVRNPETFFLNYKNICENIVFLKAQNWFPQHPEMCLRINFYHKIIQKKYFWIRWMQFWQHNIGVYQLQKSENFQLKIRKWRRIFSMQDKLLKMYFPVRTVQFWQPKWLFRKSPQSFCSRSNVLTQVKFFPRK